MSRRTLYRCELCGEETEVPARWAEVRRFGDGMTISLGGGTSIPEYYCDECVDGMVTYAERVQAGKPLYRLAKAGK